MVHISLVPPMAAANAPRNLVLMGLLSKISVDILSVSEKEGVGKPHHPDEYLTNIFSYAYYSSVIWNQYTWIDYY